MPSRWKGKCQTGQQFNENHCNKKLIGVRWYSRGVDKDALQGEYLSARDLNGHGTHTASTAAGVLVPNVSFNGIAAGAARGGAPRARLAMYKVCWGVGGACFDAPILKAIDDAIHDGVDVLSLSLGSFVDEQMGTLFAVSKGMTIVFAAGNDGPAPQTVSASVPWIISVAASTLDRSFPTVLNFDNNLKLVVPIPYMWLQCFFFLLLFFVFGNPLSTINRQFTSFNCRLKVCSMRANTVLSNHLLLATGTIIQLSIYM